jgi:prolyl-tRNA synthetase
MRQSVLPKTLREAPADIELPGQQFAIRAGVFRVTGSGLHAWLPLGQRALDRLWGLARAAVESAGAQAISLPALQAADIPAPAEFAVRDRMGRQYKLDDGDRAALLRAIQNDFASYRQLPAMVYRIATLFRDEEKPRGLLRAREFAALSATSLHASVADLEAFYPGVLDALHGVLRQCGLETWTTPTRDGHEFLLPLPASDEAAFACGSCSYRATWDEARFVKIQPPISNTQPTISAVHQVATPGCHTIAALAAFLNVPAAQTLKTMMYADEAGSVIFAVIRGDLDINAAKLERAARHTQLSTGKLQPATDAQIRAAGAVPGYASPIGLSSVSVIADDSVQSAVGMVIGANEEGYHLTGVSIPRDLAPTAVADIAQARAGDTCPECRGKLEAVNALELGECVRMGPDLSEALGITFQDRDGKARPFVLGGYGLGLSRVIAAVLETSHDERGLIWPAALAPFDVHMIVLGKEPRERAEALYEQFEQAGLSVLYDDRDESPGVKFTDADLMGLPTRVTVSKRGLDKGGVEIKARTSTEARTVAIEDALTAIKG